MQGFGVMVGVAATSAFGLTCNPLGVMATAGTPPTKEELERIKTGYKQIQYLLDNFEQETTTCRENGGECKRDAEPIRRVLGLRSTTDPLFQIEKGVYACGVSVFVFALRVCNCCEYVELIWKRESR
jgi:hypothetical protein